MQVAIAQSRKVETYDKEIAHLLKLFKKSKASGYTRYKSYDSFAKGIGLRK
jgi:hypothetical protein